MHVLQNQHSSPHLACQRFCMAKEGRKLWVQGPWGGGSTDWHNSPGWARAWPWETLSLDSDRCKGEENTTITQSTQYNLNLGHVHPVFSKNTIRKWCDSCVATTIYISPYILSTWFTLQSEYLKCWYLTLPRPWPSSWRGWACKDTCGLVISLVFARLG